MKLPEAIALMLEGHRVFDGDRIACRAWSEPESGLIVFQGWEDGEWLPMYWFDPDGWREATPEELKEIGMEPRA